MATNYSLLCWGGKDGKTVSISATTDNVTLANHGLINGTKLWPSGTLPAELSVGTAVYARSITSSTFSLHTTAADAIANTSKILYAGSSTYASVVLTSDFWYSFDTVHGLVYDVDKTRYGSPGSEFCYASYTAWLTAAQARHASADLDTEVLEVGEAFDDYISAGVTVAQNCATWRVESKINGIRTPAFHNGQAGTNNPHTGLGTYGYCLYFDTSAIRPVINLDGSINGIIDGITMATDKGSTTLIRHYSPASGFNNVIKNNIIFGFGTPTASYGIHMRADFYTIYRNIIFGFTGVGSMGLYFYNYNEAKASYVANNLATKNTLGFGSEYNSAITFGYFFNNESTGNTTNWGGTGPSTSGFHSAGYNMGERTGATYDGNGKYVSGGSWTKGTPWYKTTDTGVTANSTPANDFMDWTNNDFRPAAVGTAAQIDAGVAVYGMDAFDIDNDEVPAYNNGSTETWDIGPFEKDLGYTRPALREITVNGFVTGTQVKIFDTGTQDVLDSVTSGTTITYDAGADGVTVDVTIYKAGKIFQRYTGIALTAENYTLTVTQVDDQNYVASSGLTYGTNLTYDATVAGGNKHLKVNAATTGRNLYSALIEAFIAETGLENLAFNFEMNGPGGLILKNGAETRGYSTAGTGISNTSLDYMTDDGLTYLDTSGTATAIWACIKTQGVPTGKQARYQQVDGSGTTNAEATGDVNQLVQVYGGVSHGNFDKRSWMVWKVQSPGYDEARTDVVAVNGNMEGQGYIVPLVPIANGIADAAGITNLTFTDHGASPVTWNSKDFSITIEDDDDSHTGEEIIQWIRNANNFNRHDLVQLNGSAYKTVRGYLEGDSGAGLKGVRVVRSDGTTAHYDFTLFTADDGTTYAPTIVTAVQATAAANTRFVLYNVTQDAEIDNSFSAGGSYSYVITTEADDGDTLDLHYFKEGYEEGRTRFTWGAVTQTVAIEQSVHTAITSLRTSLGISDYTTITEFALDITGAIEIDADDADGDTQKARIAIWYNGILTTEDGARHLRGAISILATNQIRINVDVLDLTVENISVTYGLKFTDVERRFWRSDGTPVYAATSAPGSIENDYSGVPDTVETGVSGLTAQESADLATAASSASAAQTAAERALTVPKFLALK